MKKIVLSLILLNIVGCVNSEVAEGPDKIKSATVWSSDLRLNYDSLYGKERRRGEEPTYEEYDNSVDGYVATLDKVIAEEIEGPIEIEVNSMDVDKLIKENVSLKIKNDELETKKFDDTTDIEVEEREEPKKTKWLLLLVSLVTLGGFYSTIKKKNKK